MFKKILSALLLMANVLSGSVFAISLGDSEIFSRLGEPVLVEVEVLQWEEVTLNQLEVVFASEANYRAFGLEYSPVLTELELSIPEPINDKLVILITGNDGMQEPFMEILLLLRWPGGSLLREYVLFFDPLPSSTRVTNSTRAPVVIRTPVPTAATESLVEEPELEPESVVPEPSVPELEPVDAEVVIERREYLVQPGDSLWNIALQFQTVQSDYNFFQMLLGIFELNPSAFENGNISMLRENQTIVIPGIRDINNIDPNTAEDIYNQHWEESIEEFDTQDEEPPLASIISPANGEPAEETRFIPEEPESLNESTSTEDTLRNASVNDESSSDNPEPTSFESVTDSGPVVVPSNEVAANEVAANEVAAPNPRPNPPLDSAQAPIQNPASNPVPDSEPAVEPALEETSPANPQSQNQTVLSRGQHIEQLEAQVSNMRQQLQDVKSISVRLARTLDTIREKRENRQKTMDRIVYILFAIAFSSTVGLIYYVMRGSRRQPKRRRRVR